MCSYLCTVWGRIPKPTPIIYVRARSHRQKGKRHDIYGQNECTWAPPRASCNTFITPHKIYRQYVPAPMPENDLTLPLPPTLFSPLFLAQQRDGDGRGKFEEKPAKIMCIQPTLQQCVAINNKHYRAGVSGTPPPSSSSAPANYPAEGERSGSAVEYVSESVHCFEWAPPPSMLDVLFYCATGRQLN